MRIILEKIASDSKLEIRWLNTLSQLEHIGARKIGKTVAQTHPTLEILEHYADETRHAYAFKRLSTQLSEWVRLPQEAPTYLCRSEAIQYFQELDRQAAHWLSEAVQTDDPYINYLMTTSLIERRAMQLYPLYRDLTEHDSVKVELDQIIQEESNHRKGIDAGLRKILKGVGYNLSDVWPLEDKLFTRFVKQLESHLSPRHSRLTPYHQDPDLKIYAE